MAFRRTIARWPGLTRAAKRRLMLVAMIGAAVISVDAIEKANRRFEGP